MIQEQTKLNVADNSGAKMVKCIKVLGGSKKKFACIGDIIKVSVKEISNKSKIKRGEVLKAVIVRSKKGIRRKDGSYIKFNNNSCVILSNLEQIMCTRIFGSITRELKKEKFMKIISLANEVI